jgi:uncharacterized protein (TIGR03083 family)
MPVDHPAVIESESERLLAAYSADPDGRIPWSDRWSVGTVARHVAGTHHVVSQVIGERPAADFGRFRTLDAPAKGDPGFPAWFAAGTAALVEQCRTTPAAEPCWSWHPDGGGTVCFWTRRMAHETLFHRWDAEAGAGLLGAPMDPAVAADAVDEMLDVFVSAGRALHGSPPGPAVRLSSTDTGDDWYLDLAEAGRRTVHTAAVDVALTLRGPAEALVLLLWGRGDAETVGVRVEGDGDVLAEWTTLVPPM